MSERDPKRIVSERESLLAIAKSLVDSINLILNAKLDLSPELVSSKEELEKLILDPDIGEQALAGAIKKIHTLTRDEQHYIHLDRMTKPVDKPDESL